MFKFKLILAILVIGASAILSDCAVPIPKPKLPVEDEEYEIDLLSDKSFRELFPQSNNGIQPRWIFDGPAKNAVKTMISQLPCGWPEYGIPPLAPYTNHNLTFNYKDQTFTSLMNLLRLKVEGLDTLQVKDLKVTLIFNKKAKFHVYFKRLRISSTQFETSTVVDLLKSMGIALRYNGTGPLDFTINDLNIVGTTKFTLPIIWGSVEIYGFDSSIKVGSVKSKIGLMKNNKFLNEMINEQIENLLPAFLNSNKGALNPIMETQILPMANKFLKGTKIWSLINLWLSSSPKCVPKPAPWAFEKH